MSSNDTSPRLHLSVFICQAVSVTKVTALNALQVDRARRIASNIAKLLELLRKES